MTFIWQNMRNQIHEQEKNKMNIHRVLQVFNDGKERK